MTRWHRSRLADMALRLAGLGACGLACAAIALLLREHRAAPAGWSPGILDYMLAAIAFLCASGGGVAATMGRHLFDKIETSERWRRTREPSAPVHGSSGVPGPAAIGPSVRTAAEPIRLVPRPGARRSVAREDASLLLRRSAASMAALRLRADGASRGSSIPVAASLRVDA